MRFKASASGAAIYDEVAAGGDGPYTSPLSFLPQLRFHSSLRYPAAALVVTGITVNLAAVAADSINERVQTFTLFAHGQGGIPYVEGVITSGLGQPVALCGSVPVQTCGSGAAGQFVRVVHLGADGSNVYLNDYGATFETAGFAALSLILTVYVMDVLL